MKKRLTKSIKDRKLDGVCGGVAEYFNIDSTIVRFVWFALCFVKGFGIILYVVALIVMPNAPDSNYSDDDNIDNLKSANVDEKNEKKNEKKSSGKSKSDNNDAIHSDEDFDSFFKNK